MSHATDVDILITEYDEPRDRFGCRPREIKMISVSMPVDAERMASLILAWKDLGMPDEITSPDGKTESLIGRESQFDRG